METPRLRERTLKRIYETKDDRRLLTEADQAVINQINAALGKLKNLVPEGANLFNLGIENATAALGKMLQGGVVQKFKNIFDDPVAKSSMLASAIQQGMSQLPTAVQIYLPKGSEKVNDKHIWEMCPPDKQNDLLKAATDMFKAKTNLTMKLSGEQFPYVGNLRAAVQELLENLSPAGGWKLAGAAKTAAAPPVQGANGPVDTTKNPDAAAGDKGGTNQTNGAATPATGAAPTTVATPAGANAPTKGTPGTTPTGTQASAPGKKLNAKADAARIAELSKFVLKQIGSGGTVQQAMSKLAELGALSDIVTPGAPTQAPEAVPGNKPATPGDKTAAPPTANVTAPGKAG